MLGRRGPAQAAFTNPELLELGEMADADVFVTDETCALDPLSAAWLESDEAHTTSRKNVEILHRLLGPRAGGQATADRAALPRLAGGDPRRRQVEGVRICRNELTQDESGAMRAAPTERTEETPRAGSCSARSATAACRCRASPSTSAAARSRTSRAAYSTGDGSPLPGEYVVGWIKRGPSGIIGTNKRDAQETVDLLLEDLDADRLLQPADPDRDSLEELLHERKPDHVTYAGWEAIDAAEKAAGEPHGRPRVKLATFDELLEAAAEARRARVPGA